MACVIGHQRQPRYGHGNHQVRGRQKTHAAVARSCPKGLQPLARKLRTELPGQPQQRSNHQRQAKPADDFSDESSHGTGQKQRQDRTPQYRRDDRTAHAIKVEPEGLFANRGGAVAHDDKFKGGPPDQLHDIQDYRQAREMAPEGRAHQSGTRQSAIAAKLGRPCQQAGPNHGAQQDGNHGVATPDRGHEIGADLDDQQTHAQTEPERGVFMPVKDPIVFGNRGQCLVVRGEHVRDGLPGE